jgi:hypothetical protein
MDAARIYWAALGVFGLTAVVDAGTEVAVGVTGLPTLVTLFAGLLVLVTALAGLRNPRSAGAPESSGAVLYLVLTGTGVYVALTAFELLG